MDLLKRKEKKERIQTFKETGDSRYINRNELDKAYFLYDIFTKMNLIRLVSSMIWLAQILKIQ